MNDDIQSEGLTPKTMAYRIGAFNLTAERLTAFTCEIHDLLQAYVRIHNDTFRFSISRLLGRIDYQKQAAVLDGIANEIQRVTMQLDISGADSREIVQRSTPLKRYGLSLERTVRSLAAISQRLRQQTDGVTYTKSEYDRDIKQYNDLRAECSTLGSELEKP